MNNSGEKKDWVGGVCINDGKVLLIHRINNELPVKKEYFVFPGKDVSQDETIETAVEKAFADFSITISLQGLVYSKEDEINGSEYYYQCDYVLGEPAVIAGSNEAIEMETGDQVFIPIWVPLTELNDLVVYPESVKEKILEDVFE